MPDFYLEDPTRLNGKPKLTIGNYVELALNAEIEAGKLFLPRRFNTSEEAEASGLPILCRSEHPQEYNGISGLLESLNLREFIGKVTEEGLINRLCSDRKEEIKAYCAFLGIDRAQFMKQIGLSYWEGIYGYNRSVVADTAIARRYHITTLKNPRGFSETISINYCVFENGKIVASYQKDLPESLLADLTNLVDIYERVRNLNHFEKNNCPIMELQTNTDQGVKNYFLQYHRSRTFSHSTFVLDRQAEGEEVEALFTRGATPESGLHLRLTVAYATIASLRLRGEGFFNSGIRPEKYELPKIREASIVDTRYSPFIDLIYPELKLQVVEEEEGLGNHQLGNCVYHGMRSKLFKPEVTILIPSGSLISEKERKEKERLAKETGEDQFIDVRVVSDGRRALIRRV
jgi:hypothetical protein